MLRERLQRYVLVHYLDLGLQQPEAKIGERLRRVGKTLLIEVNSNNNIVDKLKLVGP